SGILVHKNKTLLLKHKFLPLWTPPAGHIELHETPEEALYREVAEEAGITREHLSFINTNQGMELFDRRSSVVDLVPFDIESHPIGDDGHRHIDMAYVLESTTDRVRPADGESQELRWFSLEELDTFTEAPVSIIKRGKFAIELVNRRNQK
ncbi:MAG: NUDIX domain-containing protein, partial [Candidatus Saccharimonadales bacterium]